MKSEWTKMTNEELCLEYQCSNSEELFEYFLDRNLGLVIDFIKNVIKTHREDEDILMQAGKVAVWRAMKAFDDSKGTKFSTILQYYIMHELRGYYYTKSTVKLPHHLLDNITDAKEKYPFALFNAISLDENINNEENDRCTLLDRIADDNDKPTELIEEKDEKSVIVKLIEELAPRKQQLLKMYYGLDGYERHSLQEIGNHYGLTRERIRQVLIQAKDELKIKLEKNGILN